MTDFDFSAFAHRDAACADTAKVSSFLAEVLGLDRVVLSAEVGLVVRTVNGEAGYLKLADDDFLLL